MNQMRIIDLYEVTRGIIDDITCGAHCFHLINSNVIIFYNGQWKVNL